MAAELHPSEQRRATTVRLFQGNALRQRIGAGGRRFVLKHLSWNTIAAQMEALYGQILYEKGKTPLNCKEH